MTQNEIAEIRRRYRADKSNISRICGCFVSGEKEIISEFDQSMGTMTPDDADGMLAVLKKVLSGSLGRNLLDIEFSTAQVNESEDYKLIASLRASELKDALKEAGFDIAEGVHPIVPVMLYDAKTAQEFAARMLQKGVYVVGFCYPVVPQGKARIRTQVSAAHSREDLDFALKCFIEVRDEMGL